MLADKKLGRVRLGTSTPELRSNPIDDTIHPYTSPSIHYAATTSVITTFGRVTPRRLTLFLTHSK
jgi:hypothetical protein